jgi:hypothetical protein
MDLAIAAISDARGSEVPVELVASQPGSVGELMARLEMPMTIVAMSSAVADAARQAATEGLEPGLLGIEVTLADASQSSRPVRHLAAVWMAPERSTYRRLAQDIDASLAPGALLAVIGAGPLAVVRSRLGNGHGEVQSTGVDPASVGSALGYRTIATWRLLGLRSLAWAGLRAGAERVRRPDLADRFEASYRLALDAGDRARLWSMGVWVGRKAGPE